MAGTGIHPALAGKKERAAGAPRDGVGNQQPSKVAFYSDEEVTRRLNEPHPKPQPPPTPTVRHVVGVTGGRPPSPPMPARPATTNAVATPSKIPPNTALKSEARTDAQGRIVVDIRSTDGKVLQFTLTLSQ
ncbi:hypothetical protein DB346_07800 [Verrucomicrobia bacterium LW23]|nr:hypothetical protein DB346_07800 [Verrucomicrobia bacterium LW23]